MPAIYRTLILLVLLSNCSAACYGREERAVTTGCYRVEDPDKAYDEIVKNSSYYAEDLHFIDMTANELKEKHQYGKAERLLKMALAMEEKKEGKTNPILVNRLRAIQQVLKNNRKAREAAAVDKRINAILAQGRIQLPALPPVKPPKPGFVDFEAVDLFWRLRSTGDVYEAEHDPRSARRYYSNALILGDKTFNPDFENVVEVVRKLAKLDSQCGEHRHSELMYRRLVAFDRKNSSRSLQYLVADLGHLAAECKAQRQEANAKLLYEEAVKFANSQHPADLESIGRAKIELARILESEGKLAAARDLYFQVTEMSGLFDKNEMKTAQREYARLRKKAACGLLNATDPRSAS